MSLPCPVPMPPASSQRRGFAAGTARRLPTAEREEERRLNTRTLTIASVASASAAAVTSQLWIAGTWIAAALTPVLVALIWRRSTGPRSASRAPGPRSASRAPPPRRRAQTATRAEPAAVTGSAGPVRVYRQTQRGVTESERGRPTLAGRRIPWRAVLLTGAAAFAIAIATITVIDLASDRFGAIRHPLGQQQRVSGAGHRVSRSSREQGADRQQQPTSTAADPTTTQPDQQQTTPSETAPGARRRSDTAPARPDLQNTSCP